MTKLIKTIKEIQEELKKSTRPIGLVPTMGALHDGHISLINAAKEESKTVVVYVFVNPLQFAPNEDYKTYPRDVNGDLEKSKIQEVDYVFAPNVEEVFPNIEEFKNNLITPPDSLEKILCGKTRTDHFKGVATVIKRFFDIVQPQNIYFGQKDLQQLYVIRWLIDKYNLAINLRECPTVREINNLALSSRNNYLKEDEIQVAAHMYESLKMAKDNVKSGMFTPKKAILESIVFLSKFPQIKVEYFEARDKDSLKEVEETKTKGFYFLMAARVGNVRLIDNIEI